MKDLWKILLFFWIPLSACTNFVITAKDGTIVNGRSMEFGTDLEAKFMTVPAKTPMQSSLPKNQTGHSWVTKYSLIGVAVFGSESLVDGMNEKGLSVGALWFPGSEYPKVSNNSSKVRIGVLDLTGWLLGTFATVDEAKAGLQMVQVLGQTIPEMEGALPLHFSLHDRLGKSLVIEFIDGQMEIFDNVVGVLTNAPKFEWHTTNLRNYINLSAINIKPVKLDGSVLEQTGQGSGLLGIPGDWTPPSRFVKMAAFKNFVTKAKDAKKNVNLAFHLLNTVDIPYGAVQNASGKDFDYTQWVVVKDLMNDRLYYRTYEDLDIRVIDLKAMIQKGGNSIQKTPL